MARNARLAICRVLRALTDEVDELGASVTCRGRIPCLKAAYALRGTGRWPGRRARTLRRNRRASVSGIRYTPSAYPAGGSTRSLRSS